ncbi:MAG: orotate phosphoribosyltransferase [Bacteroidetes bacterium]|nr:orotate phosphoribosyltransferase [Bacteroidota bacterium]
MNEETALAVAEFLLQIKAIKLDVNKPFTWASGLKSPIYCDNRKTLSYPKVRTYIRQEFVKLINEAFGTVDVVAGVATGAIAQGALVAQEMGLPFVYVRSSKKGHGLDNQIEGVIESGQSVIVVEDLVSTGQSSLAAVHALREAGCNVKGMVAIFSYNLKVAEENFKAAGCILNTLTDYEHLIKRAHEQEYIKEADLKSLVEWRENPQSWSDKFID